MSEEAQPETRSDGEDKGGEPARDKAANSYDIGMVNDVRQSFNGRIETAYIGVHSSDGAGERAPKVTTSTGLVDDSDIEALGRFVQPDCFDDGLSQLARDQILVLCGPADTGKRSSALSLLREVTNETLYMLSPHVSVTELAEYEYEAGCGYVVFDRVVDRGAKESDFDWRLARDQVVKNGCYLVVTQPHEVTERFGHTTWQAPAAEKVLRAYWDQEWSPDQAAVLSEVLCTVDRVRDLVGLAQQLAGGSTLEDALNHLDSRVRAVVENWFDEHTDDHARISEITTLAFTVGVDERTFEAAHLRFKRLLDKYMPPAEPKAAEGEAQEGAAEAKRFYSTRALWRENDLVATVEIRTELGTRNAMVFAKSGYHRHVLAQLWRRMGVAFWDAVKDWLDEIVLRTQGYEFSAAGGLAELGAVAIGEVVPTLDHWARGNRGTAGQRAAVYTLYLMAQDDSLAPTALKIATEWITRGEPTHRWVGTMAFIGELGVRYPHDARRRLWQVCMQSHTVDGDVEKVFGELFSTLVRSSGNAHLVLNFLVERVKRFIRPGARPKTRTITARVVIAVIASRDENTKRSTVLAHLTERPEHTDLIAELLAGVLMHRPTREQALRALHMVLEDLARDAETAGTRAHALGEALRAHLPRDEHGALEEDLRTVAARRTKGIDIKSLINAILDALQGRGDNDE
ncbi:hypothetical protein V5P93_000711 [Actinokineospora auranticolor]|uniref:Uncharacterized protein n=1 Tax=Actinokineospora auranticolor TaxID=155976 RepID=A0A2S6GYX4_9PSEU|nr:hypothetical protein [Actinokineospora auranticolor]PPK70408.1 hypothetical protein CLV40_102323 [Actinokineospora auranticolor]